MRAPLAVLAVLALAALPPGDAATVHVHILGFQFQQPEIHIKTGDNVTWDNHDGSSHTVTSVDGRFASSGTLAQGNVHLVAFPSPGTFPYTCSFHPYMEGKVVVTPAPPPNRPPVVTLESPAPGAVVKGTVAITGRVSDPDGQPAVVDVRIDNGNWMRTSGFPDWTFHWDTRTVANGTHVLRARASDGGPFVESAARNVTVANPGAPPPAPRLVLSDLRAPVDTRVGGEVEVTAVLGNAGTARGSATARFFLDGVQRATQTATVEPGASTPLSVRLVMEEAGTHTLSASIEGQAPLGPRLIVVDPAVEDEDGPGRPPPAAGNRIALDWALAVLALAAAAARRR